MAVAPAPPQLDLETLDRVQRRVLWLATAIVHHANRVRPNASGVKVGGHQASSASMVSLMTAREAPEVAARVVTVSPDVGTSTNLGGWINMAGIWNPFPPTHPGATDRVDWFADDSDTLVRWRETDHGQHIELYDHHQIDAEAVIGAALDLLA